MSRGSRALVLCADDYALSAAVSNGIVDLVEQRRLSAVSCLVESPRWEEDARALRPLADRVDIGLHFNLTHDFGRGAWRLYRLIAGGLLRALPRRAIRERLETQLDRFEAVIGRPPDFLDGHQHVHALPGVADVFMDVCEQRFTEHKPYIRRPVPEGGAFKARVLRTLVGRRWVTRCRAAGFAVNEQFLGLYGFSADGGYPARMRAWLAAVDRPRALMLCHPARPDGDTRDPIAAAREEEYRYLAGPAFEADCRAAGVRIARFADAGAA